MRIVLLILLIVPFSVRAEESYKTTFTKHLTKYFSYPESAKLYGIEGNALIRVRVDRGGDIIAYRFVKKSKSTILNSEIVKMLKKITHSPPMPSSYLPDKKVVEFMLPVVFSIKNPTKVLVMVDKFFQKKTREAWRGKK